jgi:hypothetical protein
MSDQKNHMLEISERFMLFHQVRPNLSAWYEQLIAWGNAAGYEKDRDWARRLGLPIRTLESWSQGKINPTPETSLRPLLKELATVQRRDLSNRLHFTAGEVIDWLALCGHSPAA